VTDVPEVLSQRDRTMPGDIYDNGYWQMHSASGFPVGLLYIRSLRTESPAETHANDWSKPQRRRWGWQRDLFTNCCKFVSDVIKYKKNQPC
jgi:hypothetical protein